MTKQLQHVRAYGIADTSVVVCQSVPSVEGMRVYPQMDWSKLLNEAGTVLMRSADVIVTDKGAVYWNGDKAK